jgi:uncharacterized protein YjbJ (UPF0337 family)
MNKDIFQGEWTQLKGKIKEKWGKLTDNDLTEINGKREQLIGKLQKAYGFTREKVERELAEWEKSNERERSLSGSKNQSRGF